MSIQSPSRPHASTSTDDAGGRLSDAATATGAALSDTASSVADAGRDAAAAAQEVAVDAYDSISRFAREQPLIAIAAAAAAAIAAGVVISKLSRPAAGSTALLDRIADAIEPHTRALSRRL